jgi:hypothetical protein
VLWRRSDDARPSSRAPQQGLSAGGRADATYATGRICTARWAPWFRRTVGRAHALCLPLNSGFSRSASGEVLSRLGTRSRSGGLLQTSRSDRDRLVGAQTEASARSRRIDVASACGHVDAWAGSERRPKSDPTNVSTTAPLEAQPDLRPGARRSVCGVRLAPAEPNRLRRSTAPSGARTRTSALRRSSEGGCLQRDPCCSTTQINGRVTEKWLHAHFRAKPGHEKSLRVAGLSHSGGGIRTRDLRVMRGGFEGVSYLLFCRALLILGEADCG